MAKHDEHPPPYTNPVPPQPPQQAYGAPPGDYNQQPGMQYPNPYGQQGAYGQPGPYAQQPGGPYPAPGQPGPYGQQPMYYPPQQRQKRGPGFFEACLAGMACCCCLDILF